jgi:hypothetical protein
MTAETPYTPTVDSLAQEIRRVDGTHNLGAGALAEALMPWLAEHDAALRAERDEARAVIDDLATMGQRARTTDEFYHESGERLAAYREEHPDA